MSGALTRLRQLFNEELFVRSPTGMQPTPRADDLAGPISTSLRLMQSVLHDDGFDPGTNAFRWPPSSHAPAERRHGQHAQAYAQEATPVPDAEPASDGRLETIVVTARRRSEGLQDVPVSITSVSGKALENSNYRSVTDLQYVVPGVQFDATPSETNDARTLVSLGRRQVRIASCRRTGSCGRSRCWSSFAGHPCRQIARSARRRC